MGARHAARQPSPSYIDSIVDQARGLGTQVEQKERFIARSDVAFVFHAFALLFYVRTWLWHTSLAASALPGSQGFGWFFRYLTFCSYTLQTVQLMVCCLAHVSRDKQRKQRLSLLADRLSCALFGIANTVTALFFAIEKSTKGLVEGGGLERPAWLNLAVHVANSAVAWLDLLIVEERSFHGGSRHLALLIALAYCIWLLVVRHNFGKFPYPVMNKLPFPHGFLGFAVVGVALVLGIFHLGKTLKQVLGRLGSSGGSTGRAGGGKGKGKGKPKDQ